MSFFILSVIKRFAFVFTLSGIFIITIGLLLELITTATNDNQMSLIFYHAWTTHENTTVAYPSRLPVL